MRRIALLLLATISLLATAPAQTRPHYGGTLHVALRAAPATLDPVELERLSPNIARLLYDTLVTLDDRGIAQPGLATSWQSDSGKQRWQFVLRRRVNFSDGTPMTAESVAAALQAGNSTWRVTADTESVVVQLDSSGLDLPAELALVRNSIVRREGEKMAGTGPFTAAQWQASKKLTAVARDDYFGGRPFLDSIDIDLNVTRAPDGSRYQLAEVAPRSAGLIGISAPSDLLALVFTRAALSPEEGRLRDALSLSVDRKVLNDVLLQGGGEPARGMLPGWMTGYDFLFSADSNFRLARQAVSNAKQTSAWTLGYDTGDPTARLMAERIALNAADAGIKVAPSANGAPDLRLVRLKLDSLDPHVALANLAINVGATPPKFASDSSEELYGAERALVQSQRIIPLVHLKTSFLLGTSVRGWAMSRNGDWHLADVWLGAETP
jgi:ABC-type transport system substrate-binding protein